MRSPPEYSRCRNSPSTSGDFEKFKAAIDADAVVQMHHVVVLLELAQAGQKMARIALARRRLAFARAENLVESNEDEMRFGQTKTLMEMAAHDRAGKVRRVASTAGSEFFEHRQLKIVIGQELSQTRRIALGRRDENHLLCLPSS